MGASSMGRFPSEDEARVASGLVCAARRWYWFEADTRRPL